MIQGSSTVQDVSVTANGSVQTAVAANQYRNFLQINPAAHTVTVSFTNSGAASGATGCFNIATTDLPRIYQGAGVPNGPVYVKGTASDVISIIEGSAS